MKNEYENNMRFLPVLKFFDKYKKLIISLFIIIIIATAYFVISNQVKKQNNENASVIYSLWLKEISVENPDPENLDSILNQLITEYKNTGYTQLALLNKASLDARNNNVELALINFKTLIELTDGFNGNKIFNKIARVSASRLLLSNGNYEEALSLIELYSSGSTNGYIHELTGDILAKQNKIELAVAQYELASEKYNDETSQSIISMKIANIGM
jgi:predicted negative regulator of RcsB-dependent stress response